MEKKFTKDTALQELLEADKEEILSKHNVPCLGCAMASAEKGFLKVGDIAKAYGIDLKKLLQDLNKKK